MDKLTRAQAESVMAELRAFYKHTLSDWDGGDLALVRDWDWMDDGPRDWAIVWEEGQYYWPNEFSEHYNAMGLHFTDAATHWAICLYPRT